MLASADGTNCLESCPPGQLANTTTHICEHCTFPCSECLVTKTACTKCALENDDGAFFYLKKLSVEAAFGECVNECGDGLIGVASASDDLTTAN